MAIACQANSKGCVTGIDPWSAVCSTDGMDGENLGWWGSIDHEAIYQGLVSKVYQFGLQNTVVLVKDTSENAAIVESIDILHIDGNHSEKSALFDVTKWVPHVRKGGIIVMDDLNWEGPRRAVEWLDKNCVRLATFNDTGSDWGLWIRQ
jgi:hypothetical protein